MVQQEIAQRATDQNRQGQGAILHAIDTTGPGGAETVFLDLVEHLQFTGYQNIAVIKGPGWVEDQLKKRGVHYFIVKPKSGFSLAYYWQLAKILRHYNVKLIQAHLLGSTLTYSLLAIFLRIPLVATLHGRVDVNPNEKFVSIKQKIMRWGVSRLISVSQDLAAYIESRGLFAKKDMAIIYNGIAVARYQKTKDQDLRQQLGITKKNFLIGSLGNVRPAKAYDQLIRAAHLVLQKNPDVHFVIAGHQKKNLMDELQVLMQQLNVESNIHFIGFLDNTAHYLGQLDLFLLSSSSEGFSIATIEAMATGLPVIATRCGGPEEIIDHGINGILAPVNNSELLAQTMNELIGNKKECKRLAAEGRAHVERTFSQAKSLQLYTQEYAKFLPHLIS